MPSKDLRHKIQDLRLNKWGFSLVELMLALGLIALVTAVAIPNLREYNTSQEIGIAAERFMLTIRNTQSSASSGVQCPTGELATSWQVNLNLAATPDTYSVVVNCKTPLTGVIVARTVSTSNFTTSPESTKFFTAVAESCGANVNASIFFTGNQFTYQCSGGQVLSTPALRIIMSSSDASRIAVIQPGGVLRLE